MHPRFSIAPVNWTNDDDPSLGGDIPLEQCLKEMNQAGYEGCELGNKFPKSEFDLERCLSQFNLTLTTDWIGTNFTLDGALNESLKFFRDRCEFLAHFGVEALKVCEVGHSIQQTARPVFSSKVVFDAQQWRSLVRGLNDAAKIARDHGMYIAYHHHLGTGVQSREEIDRLMNDTTPECVSLLPDTGHLFAASVDPVAVFQTYSSRIKYVHLKDVRADVLAKAHLSNMSFMDAVRAGLFTVPGDGCIDFPRVFSLLKEMQYAGWLVVEAEQDPKKAPPLLYAQKARELLRQHFSC